jgi:Ca2+-binding EF-hand superfamily protein
MKANKIVKEAREEVRSSEVSPRNQAPGKPAKPTRLQPIDDRPEWNPSVGQVAPFFGNPDHYRILEPYKPPLDCVQRDLANDRMPFITALRPLEKFKPLSGENSPRDGPSDEAKAQQQPKTARDKSSSEAADASAEEKPARSKSAPRAKPVPAPPPATDAKPRPAPRPKDESKAAADSKPAAKPKQPDPKPPKSVKPEPKKTDDKGKKPAAAPGSQKKGTTATTATTDSGRLTMATDDEIAKLFDRLDANGNGFLSLAELDLGVKSLYPSLDNKPAVLRAYKAADEDHTGMIAKPEFKFFVQFLVYHNNLWAAFAAADDDGDRRITKPEFRDIAPALKVDDADDVFDEMDLNHGGFILFEEFCGWIAKYRPGLDIDLRREVVKVTKAAEAKKHQPAVNHPKTHAAAEPAPAAAQKIAVPPQKECMALFHRMDPNGNGMLSLAELDKGVLELWPEFNNKPAIMRAYKAADRDGEGFVTKGEFEFFLRFLTYYNNLWHDFAAADDSGDRRISREEFVDAAKELHVADPNKAFDEMDANHGGFVLFDEFCEWMARNKSDWGMERVEYVDDDHKEEDHKPHVNKTAPTKAAEPAPTAALKIAVPPQKECMALFHRMDPNGNGMLSLAELDKGVLELWPEFNNKPAIMRAYKAADRDGEGFVTKGEFEFFLRFLTYYNNLWHDFAAADDSGDRRISREEFVDAAKELHVADPNKAFDEMDANHGGFVLFDEFCEWMARNKSDWGMERVEYVDDDHKEADHKPHVNKTAPHKAAEPAPTAALKIAVPPQKECMALFHRMDPNGNGMLSLAELDKGVLELWPEFNNKPAIMRAYKAADRDGEGFVTKGEFEFFLRFLTYYNNLWHDFAAADDSGDRRISREEFVDAAKELHVADPNKAFDEMDANHGGFVLFDEFCEWMARNKSE